MVKGASPSLLAENCPPREVIRKHKLKKPMPTTNILQDRGRKSRRKVMTRRRREGGGGQVYCFWSDHLNVSRQEARRERREKMMAM